MVRGYKVGLVSSLREILDCDLIVVSCVDSSLSVALCKLLDTVTVVATSTKWIVVFLTSYDD
jgi:hypothetical protein